MRKTFTALLALAAFAAAGVSAAPTLARERFGVRYEQIPAGAYSIVAHVQAKPGQEAALREVTLPLVDLVRGDPKNLVYFLQEDRARPGHFIFYEVFATQADFEAHNAMPYVKDWFDKLPALAEGGVQVMRMEVLGHGRPR
ncbi:antibiotic biosynthesis monooxygenase [Caulobacter segnis]|uniref:Antibiotic biosynthesis monooxygenase n=2 Tax=Caulobacter segnis TaxID=88688 RepID=D5VK34_CAUST|nr:putative quinol monooxygenase [Caulobacter segnis]ADG10857.1 Antibiotic biosynthesis monooxygenase [Caulobacter segnis ATCC 21756]AVQ02560.1 antibiotic biosynthesis monooxygenase [Caulobacter segnis]